METSRATRRRAGRAWALLPVLALGVLLAACGGGRLGQRAGGEATSRSVAIDGVSLELPAGWDGYARWLGAERSAAEIWAASSPFVESPPRPEFPHETLRALPEDGIALEIVAEPPEPDQASWPELAQISLAHGYFLADGYEGQPAPHVSTQIIRARIADRALYVQLFFGRTRPDGAMRASANRALASLFPPREVREAGFVRFEDPAVGISGRYPAGWHWARALTLQSGWSPSAASPARRNSPRSRGSWTAWSSSRRRRLHPIPRRLLPEGELGPWAESAEAEWVRQVIRRAGYSTGRTPGAP